LVGRKEDTTQRCHPNRRRQNSLAMDRQGHGEAGEAEESDLQKRARQEAEGKEAGTEMKKRAALYCRVSTGDQNLDTQLLDLREVARQREFQVEWQSIILE